MEIYIVIFFISTFHSRFKTFWIRRCLHCRSFGCMVNVPVLSSREAKSCRPVESTRCVASEALNAVPTTMTLMTCINATRRAVTTTKSFDISHTDTDSYYTTLCSDWIPACKTNWTQTTNHRESFRGGTRENGVLIIKVFRNAFSGQKCMDTVSKSSRKLNIEILFVESIRRSECGFQQPLRQLAFGVALWRIIVRFLNASGVLAILSLSVKSLIMANLAFLKTVSQ